jgi:hypothetical protein
VNSESRAGATLASWMAFSWGSSAVVAAPQRRYRRQTAKIRHRSSKIVPLTAAHWTPASDRLRGDGQGDFKKKKGFAASSHIGLHRPQ